MNINKPTRGLKKKANWERIKWEKKRVIQKDERGQRKWD